MRHVRPPVVLYVERAALDDSGQLLVHGWAVSLTAMVTVQVFVDEAVIGAAQLGGQRDDVGKRLPGLFECAPVGLHAVEATSIAASDQACRPCACRRSV